MKDAERKYYFEGCRLALENAKAHIHVANSAIEMGEHGIAMSLYILAGEEGIKAMTILTRTVSPPDEVENSWKKTLTRHSTKHDQLKMAAFLADFSLKTWDERIITLKKQFPADIIRPEALIEKIFSSHPLLWEEYLWIQKRKKDPISLDDAIDWWSNADEEKQRGFYVDEKDNKWRSPRVVTLESAQQGRKFAVIIVEFVEKLKNDMSSTEFWDRINPNPPTK
jgi:AbiV family abortive infection protein